MLSIRGHLLLSQVMDGEVYSKLVDGKVRWFNQGIRRDGDCTAAIYVLCIGDYVRTQEWDGTELAVVSPKGREFLKLYSVYDTLDRVGDRD